MINFDPDMAAEFAKDVLCEFRLLEFRFAETEYLTDLDIPVYCNGHLYQPARFSINEILKSASLAVDKITIDLDNVDLSWTAKVLAEDIRGKDIVVYTGVRIRAGSGLRHVVQEWFWGIVRGWKIEGDTKVTISAVNEFARWNEKTLRNQSGSCPWAFKLAGGECGYTGSEDWCDQSWERCHELGNDLNFGGDRFLPGLAEKDIWWGRTQG